MHSTTLRALLLPVILITAVHAADVAAKTPYGDPDFYPSPEQPAQLRGDGSGYFPGATPVDSFDFRTGENIVWACPLPGWGFSSPIVVGDKAFVTCDWNKLVCIDVRSGEVLWAKDNHTFEHVGGEQADMLRTLFDELTVPWLKAHQAFFEMAYTEREIDLIEAARAGKPLKPSKAMHKGKLRERDSWGAICPNDHLTDAEKKELLAKAKSVDDATLQALKDRYKTLREKISDEQLGPQTSGYVGTLNPHRRHSDKAKAFEKSTLPCGTTVSNAFKQLKRHGIAFEIWNGWMGRSFSTPVSDGTHVYAQFGQHQVVCYDLAGNRQWMQVYLDERNATYRQNDSASPLLVGDKLIVLRGGSEDKPEAHTYIRAIDKHNGEELWVQRLDYVMTSHTFPNQTLVNVDGIDVVATSAGHILRVDDGKIIMKNLPAPIAAPLVVGNEVYLLCGRGQSNGHGSRMKITLERQGDEVVGSVDWAYIHEDWTTKPWTEAAQEYGTDLKIGKPHKKEPTSNVTGLFIDGKVVLHNGIYDAATGAKMRDYGRMKVGATGHLIRTGNDLIYATAGDRHTPVYNVKKLGKPKTYPLGSEWHRRIQLGKISIEEAAKNVVALPWLPHVDKHFGGQTTPWPQGNRIYIRTHDTLYCIGDPDAPYHSPASAPAAARTGD